MDEPKELQNAGQDLVPGSTDEGPVPLSRPDTGASGKPQLAEPRSLEGDAKIQSMRRWGVVQMGLLVPVGAFLVTQIADPIALSMGMLLLIVGFIRAGRRAAGYGTVVDVDDQRVSKAVHRVIKDGGLNLDQMGRPLTPEEVRLAIQDEMDLVEPPSHSWWSRGRWVAPVINGILAAGFLGLGTWFFLADNWILLAWGGWTLGISTLIGGGIQLYIVRKMERAVDLLQAQMDALDDEPPRIG